MISELKFSLAEMIFNGLSEESLAHLAIVSSYNHNYYIYKNHLLYAVSDDDNFTQWYWVVNERFLAFGGSYDSEGDVIIVDRAYT